MSISNAISPSYELAEKRQTDLVRQTLLVGLAIQLALFLPSVIVAGIDDRLLNAISVWSKPIKFQLSLIVTLATLLWLLPLLSVQQLSSRLVRWAGIAVSGASTLEIFYITLQAARGRASHFNAQTPPEAMLYSLMGVGAVVLVIGCFVFGLALWRAPRQTGQDGLRLGGAVGLMLGAVATLITAGILGSGALSDQSHWIGGIRSDANGLPLVGWSSTGGDLRVPHFFATHLMQALPILGLLADRLRLQRPLLIISLGAIGGVVVVVATFVQALAGHSFF